MKATRPLEATGLERRSVSFPSFSKACLQSNRALQTAVERGKIDQIRQFAGKGDIGCADRIGRPLTVIANSSDYLLPKQRDEVVALLKDFPGRLAALGGADDQFVGLKSNEDRWKHKHTTRNRHIVSILRQHCGANSDRDWALESTAKNPLIFNLDGEKLDKALPAWVRKAGVESAMLALQANPALGHGDPERILDVLPTLTQLLGHKDVALFFLYRQPTLLRLNQQFIRSGYRQLMAIFNNKDSVLSVLKQTTVPAKMSIMSTLQAYGSAILGSYRMELHEGQILYKKEDAELYMLLSEENRWEITKSKEPETLVPLKRCRPECYLDVSHVDPRVVMEPSQEFAQNSHWRMWAGTGWREEKKLSAVATVKKAQPTCLLHVASDILRATYSQVTEMLGIVWVHGYDYQVCADVRDGDCVFHDSDAFKFRQLGEFSSQRKFTFISPMYATWKAAPGEADAGDRTVQVLFWEPATVYRLFWVESDEVLEGFDPGERWVRVENLSTPKIQPTPNQTWPNGSWVVFWKSFPPGGACIPLTHGDAPEPLVFVKEGSYVVNATGVEYDVLHSTTPGSEVFAMDSDVPVKEVAEGEEQEGDPNRFEFLSFQAFDSFNGYVYIRCADKDRSIAGKDSWFTLTVPQPMAVYLVYFDAVPGETRAWHFTEGWSQANVKAPVIRDGTGAAHDAVEVRTRNFEKGKACFRGNAGARCAVWYKYLPLKDEETNAAQRLLRANPLLFPQHANVELLIQRLRNQLGDQHAHKVLAEDTRWIPVVLSGQIEPFVQHLLRALLSELLTPEATAEAIKRLPAIYDATGPAVRGVVKALLAPCGGVQQRLKVVHAVPEVLLMTGEAVAGVWELVQSLFGAKVGRGIVFDHPRLLLCHTPLRTTLDCLSEAFSEDCARTRLSESVHESGPWQNWIKIVCAEPPTTSVEIQKWIGQLQSLETRRTIYARKGVPPAS